MEGARFELSVPVREGQCSSRLARYGSNPFQTWKAVLLRPESRGRIELASSDPRVPVRIHQNFLATEKDWATLRTGVPSRARDR
jgi:choline dehydrogenase-like flavoprotein